MEIDSDSCFADQNASRYLPLYCNVGIVYADTGIVWSV